MQIKFRMPHFIIYINRVYILLIANVPICKQQQTYPIATSEIERVSVRSYFALYAGQTLTIEIDARKWTICLSRKVTSLK